MKDSQNTLERFTFALAQNFLTTFHLDRCTLSLREHRFIDFHKVALPSTYSHSSFTVPDVKIDTSKNPKYPHQLTGMLHLDFHDGMLYLCWTRETLNDSLDLGSFLDLTTGESLHDESSHDSEHCDEYNIRLPIYSIKKYTSGWKGSSYIIITTIHGISHMPFFFKDKQELQQFFAGIVDYVGLKRSPYDQNVYIVNDFFDLLSPKKKQLKEDKDKDEPLKELLGNQFHASLGSFEVLDSSGTVEKLPNIERGSGLTKAKWEQQLDDEGRVKDPEVVKECVFYGGIAAEIRAEVWKFLVRYWKWDSTASERAKLQSEKELEYHTIKKQWETMTPEQESNWKKFRNRKLIIDKDVWRTDRYHPAFHDDDSPNLIKLRNILLTYTLYNYDMGYCQGMNDILVPILLVQEDEADAFWCFTCVMRAYGSVFKKNQTGTSAQLAKVAKLLHCLDRTFYDYLRMREAINLFFSYRWLLLLFKREFQLPDTIALWETFFSGHLHPEYHLFFAVAILIANRSEIMDKGMAFDQILQYVTKLAGNLNLEQLLNLATALCLSFEMTTDDEVKRSIFETTEA